MSLYELMFILNPDLGDEERERFLSRFQALIEKNKGEVLKIEDRGIRTLTYKIQKKSKGRYFLTYLEGPGTMISEIERNLRIDENVMRFVIINLDEQQITRDDICQVEQPVTEEAGQDQTTEEVPHGHAEQ